MVRLVVVRISATIVENTHTHIRSLFIFPPTTGEKNMDLGG